MPGSTAVAILFLGTFLEAFVVVCALYRKVFRRYFFLNLYMLLCVCASLGRFHILTQEGLTSLTYRYFYFYSDALLTIVLFFALTSLYGYVLEELKVERYVRLGAVALLVGTAWFSYSVVSQSSHRIMTYFAFELSQNLYFVGLVLTYALWGTLLKMRESRTLLVQLVLSLGIYFSAAAASYALSNLYPSLYAASAVRIEPIMGCLLPLSWAYAFWRVPDEARLAPAQLAAVPR
jgi:hypothetical protein